jgi:hypothetical protein
MPPTTQAIIKIMPPAANELKIEYRPGVFMATITMTAFDGEFELWIHITTGHYTNWTASLMRPDCAILNLPGEEYVRGTTLEKILDAVLPWAVREGNSKWLEPIIPEVKAKLLAK